MVKLIYKILLLKNRSIRLILLLVIMFCVSSCKKSFLPDLPDCNYNVLIAYNYNIENTAANDQLPRFVKNLEEFIFDASGILYKFGELKLDESTGQWKSDILLPAGQYSVIAIGNRKGMSRSHDNGREFQIGITSRNDLMITLTNRSEDGKDDGVSFNNSERLYYGYRTFTVLSNKISQVRVDMVHSHLDLRYTIKWKNDKTPQNTNDFFVMLNNVPSEYSLMPEYIYTMPGKCGVHNPILADHDRYLVKSEDVRHKIPNVFKANNIINHRKDAMMYGNSIMGQMISYRIRNAGNHRIATTISLYRSGVTHTGMPEQLMKEIHLNDFLNRNDIDLDQTLKQQYHIVFEIDPDTGKVRAWFADIADWDEGGGLGG